MDLNSLIQGWRDQKLTTKFIVSACVVIVTATIPIGLLIGNLTESNALFHRAAATALFLDNVVAPYLRTPNEGPFDDGELAAIDAILDNPALALRVPHLEVWAADGTIAYSRTRELVGSVFPLPEPAKLAFGGQVEVAISDLAAREHRTRGFNERYLEIYAPLHELGTGQIIAVMELHEDLRPLSDTVQQVRTVTWLSVLGAMSAMLGTMFLIVRGAAQTIDQQTEEMSRQLETSRQLAQSNAALHEQAVESASLKVELHENLLRSFGADLHDGPAQLLAYASLKAESVRRARDARSRAVLLADLEEKLREAQDEIRDMASGLVLPEIDQLSLETVVTEALSYSERRMGVSAHLTMADLQLACSPAQKMCVYRFLQEGLNNVWSHGAPDPTSVTIERTNEALIATIRNRVADKVKEKRARRGLGVRALKVRAESLGGSVSLAIAQSIAELQLILPINGASNA